MIDKRNIQDSQGVKLSNPEDALRPRNRIEEALYRRGISKNQLPILKKDPVPPEPKPKKKSFRLSEENVWFLKRVFAWLTVLVFVGAIVSGSYIIYREFIRDDVSEDGKLLNEVGKLIQLPTNETPAIATVTDLSMFRNEPFFEQAQMGDELILYALSKKAILYRPSEKRIIIVAPIR